MLGRVEGWQGESVGETGDGGILGKWSGVVSKEGVWFLVILELIKIKKMNQSFDK